LNVNITRNDIDALNAVISVSFTPEDYLNKVEHSLQQARKNITLKGFRKGMVPTGLVKKMHGNAILVDELNKSVNDAINQHIKDENLQILGRPLPVPSDIDFDINHPQSYTFEFELGIAPSFDLSFLSPSTVVAQKEVLVDDATIEKELEHIRSRYGKLTHPDGPVQEKDILQCKFQELENGNVKEGGIENQSPITQELIINEDFKKQLSGAKVGDQIDVNLFDLMDRTREHVIKHVLGQDENTVVANDQFRITIERIDRMEPAELNQEFYDNVFGPGKVSSVEECKAQLKTELESYLSGSVAGKLKDEIFKTLLEKVDLPLPDAFLRRWIKVSNEKPLSDEQLENEYPTFARNLKWSLIVNKIGSENKLEGTFDEIKEFSKNQLLQQLKMYNPAGGSFSDEDLEMLNNSMLAKEEHVKKAYDAVMEQKLFDFIKEKITIEVQKVSFEDFITG
jgi:trigger factor